MRVGVFHVGIDTAGTSLEAAGKGPPGLIGSCATVSGVLNVGVKGSVLIGAVAESVLQVVVHAEAGAKDGFGSERAPRYSDARLRKECCVVILKMGIADVRGGMITPFVKK